MTCLFIVAAAATLALGFGAPHLAHGQAPITHAASPVLIAQLGQLDDPGRRRFGRWTLLLTIVILSAVTLALTALAVRLHVGVPAPDETQIANLARAADDNGTGLFAFFQRVERSPTARSRRVVVPGRAWPAEGPGPRPLQR